MRAERDDARVVFEYLRGAVALVHVQVDDEYRVFGPGESLGEFPHRVRRGDGDVVEDAEALAFVSECVVGAARDLRGALGGGVRAEDVVRGGDGASGGRQRTRDLRRVHHGETDGSAFFFSQRAPEDSRDVALLVHGEDVDEARFLLGR